MSETLDAGESDFVILLDDDVTVEPESIARAVRFARHSTRPLIVGGHMFDLLNRPVLHAFAETVDLKPFVWHAQPHDDVPHDFRVSNLRQTPWMHARMDADYNGWWFCLIPTEIVRTVGLALPAFIKWDDAEYCLRARDAGYPTVTLPGAALWHVSWLDKDDSIDWQAYFHARNRFVAALLHSPHPGGGALTTDSERWDLKHLLSMQYAPAEMGLMAIEDILEGPQRMHRDLRMRLGGSNALRKQYDNSIAKQDLDQFPAARRKKPPRKGKSPSTPVGLVARAKTMALGGVRQLLPVRDLSKSHPEANIPHVDLKWWLVMQFDSALVSSADGTSAAWYKRNPPMARDLMTRSVALHARLAREWPTLAKTYQEALPELASPKRWAETFEESTDGKP